jgi:hypothetical protein
MYLSYWDENDEGQRIPFTKNMGFNSAAMELASDSFFRKCYTEMNSFVNFEAWICELFGFGGRGETKAEYESRIQKEERRRIESEARSVAENHNTEIDSITFIQAVKDEIRTIADQRSVWDSGECRAERYGACLSEGCTNTFYEDNDFEGGRFESRISNLHDILDWLARYCPLLWAQWEEIQKTVIEDEEE